MRRFELILPDSVEECLGALAAGGAETRLLAGGTDLLPQMKSGTVRPARVVDLSGVASLRAVEPGSDGTLRVGAAVTAGALERDPRIRAVSRSLAESAALVGSLQVRNLATVGGNLCNAAPSADMAPPLLALDAVAVVAGPTGRRRIPLPTFFSGVRQTQLAPDELLVTLEVPVPPPGSGDSYLRHTPRRELDIAVVGVASHLTVVAGVCTRARIALAAVAPVPLRADAAEAVLAGRPVTPEGIERAAHLAAEAARPISDQRGSADFRRHLVRVLTRRTLMVAHERAVAPAAPGTSGIPSHRERRAR